MIAPVTVELDRLTTDVLETLVARAIAQRPADLRDALDANPSTLHVRNALALLRDLGLTTEHFDADSRPLYAPTARGRDALTRGQEQG